MPLDQFPITSFGNPSTSSTFHHLSSLVKVYFEDLQLCFTATDFYNIMAARRSRHHGRQRPSAASKAGLHQQSGKRQQDPTAREAQALVPAIWTFPSGNVAINYLRAPNNNWGEDGVNHDFICEEMAGVPCCLTDISLYGKGVLELPITSLTEEYKCSKVRLQMTLKDSNKPQQNKTELAQHNEISTTQIETSRNITQLAQHNDISTTN